MTLREKIIETLKRTSGQTDRELANVIFGRDKPQQPVNQGARSLEALGLVERRKRSDGLIGNYLAGNHATKLEKAGRKSPPDRGSHAHGLSEDEIKDHLKNWLERDGWTVSVAWRNQHGVDIEAFKDAERWLIEVKGSGSRPEMRVNYLIGILGETLQRMNDPNARYAIALPDMDQFRRLWERLPELAKQRTEILALFVSESGEIRETN